MHTLFAKVFHFSAFIIEYYPQAESSVGSMMNLKHRGEASQLLAEWRSRNSTTPSATPLTTGHSATPLQLPSAPGPSGRFDKHQSPSSSDICKEHKYWPKSNRSDSSTPRSTGSVGVKSEQRVDKFDLAQQRVAQKAFSGGKEVHVKVERLSFTPASADNVSSKLPSVASSWLVCPDQKGPQATKPSQNRPQAAIATPRAPLSTTKHGCELTHSRAKETDNTSRNETTHTTTTATTKATNATTKAANETPKATNAATKAANETTKATKATTKAGNETPKATNAATKVASTEQGNECVVAEPESLAEAARKKRQELQRLQKEKWQMKHGVVGQKKRTSDTAELSTGEAEGGATGGDFLETDDLISVGEYKKIFPSKKF